VKEKEAKKAMAQAAMDVWREAGNEGTREGEEGGSEGEGE
jgi:hypothetical protein